MKKKQTFRATLELDLRHANIIRRAGEPPGLKTADDMVRRTVLLYYGAAVGPQVTRPRASAPQFDSVDSDVVLRERKKKSNIWPRIFSGETLIF